MAPAWLEVDDGDKKPIDLPSKTSAPVVPYGWLLWLDLKKNNTPHIKGKGSNATLEAAKNTFVCMDKTAASHIGVVPTTSPSQGMGDSAAIATSHVFLPSGIATETYFACPHHQPVRDLEPVASISRSLSKRRERDEKKINLS